MDNSAFKDVLAVGGHQWALDTALRLVYISALGDMKFMNRCLCIVLSAMHTQGNAPAPECGSTTLY